MAEIQPLSVLEKNDLAVCEHVIHAAEEANVDAGLAMGDIRDKNLYRQTHDTFEQYCEERWGRSKTHANRLIDAARVITAVTPIGVIPTSEAVVRPLTTLRIEGPGRKMVIDMVQVGKVWQDTVDRVEENGRERPTARDVEEMVTLWKKADEPYNDEDSEPVEDQLPEAPVMRERTNRKEEQEEGDARAKVQHQGSPAAIVALDDETIALPVLDRLVELDHSEQNAILAGGPDGVDFWFRGRLRKDAQTAPEEPEADESPGTWEEAVEALESAVDVVKKIISVESSRKAKARVSLRIQVVVDDLTDLWVLLERDDED